MDNLSPEQRSARMALIKGNNTSIEVSFRRALFRLGLRYRIAVSSLPGRPDIVLPKYNTVIFVHGCFWHRHIRCKLARSPKSNQEYWERKFQGNVLRDVRNKRKLRKLGWDVIVVWGCQLRTDAQIELKAKNIASRLWASKK